MRLIGRHTKEQRHCILSSPESEILRAAYDVTRRDTFDSIEDIWMKEVDMYATVEGAVKVIIGNKVDQASHHSHLGSRATMGHK